MKVVRAVILIGVLALASGCSRDEKKAEAASKPAEPVSVKAVAAELRQVDKTISVTGTLEPDEKVTLSAEVPGRISAIHVDFGQPVRKGQVVAELDRQELNLAVERSKAALTQALARLGLELGQVDVQPDTTPLVRQARAQMEDAKSKFDNASKLVKSGDISQERFVEAEKAFLARQAAFEASRDEMRTLSASVQALRAELKLAEKRLGDASVRAPFDGAVTEKLASPGQYMKENTPILTLVKTNPMRLRVEIPESGAGAVRVGTSLSFATDAAPGARFNAMVRELNPSLDSKSRSLTAEARLAQADSRLRPGMFVQVELVLSKNNEIVAVPKQALYTVAGLTKLFVLREGQAVEHRVITGQDLGQWIEVPRAQIQPGDQVAVSNLTQLVQGAPVRIAGKG